MDTPLDMQEIFETGDLARIYEVNDLIKSNICNRSSKEDNPFAEAFMTICMNKDGALLNAFTKLPNFYLLKNTIIEVLGQDTALNCLEDNQVFLETLCHALLPHLENDDESRLCHLLRKAITIQTIPASVLEFLDTLWSKTISSNSNDLQLKNELYVDISDENADASDSVLLVAIIHTGISRHINVMCERFNEQKHKFYLDSYTKSKLVELSMSSNMKINEKSIFGHVNSEDAVCIENWYVERKLFSSKITHKSKQRWKLSQTQHESTEQTILPKILDKMDKCASHYKSDGKRNAVNLLLSKLCKAIEEIHPNARCKHVLTGSAAECSQA